MKIIAVLAMDKNLLIGIKDNNTLPWHIPEDLKRFQNLTTGGIVVMGKNTYLSLPQKFRPLPNRRNIVITRGDIGGVECYSSIESFIEKLKKEDSQKVFLIGGATLYDQFFEKGLVDEVELTFVDDGKSHHGSGGDIHVKEWRDNFREVKSENFSQGKFITYRRK